MEWSDNLLIGRKVVRLATTCVLIGLSSIGVAACGDDGERSSQAAPGAPGLTTGTDTEPGDAPAATAPQTSTTDGTATTTTPATTGPASTTTTEIGPSAGDEESAGGEESARIPADFAVGAALNPSRITVPAFLTIELSARSSDGRAHTLRLTTPKGPVTLSVPAGGRASTDIDGLPEGEYLIAVDGVPGDSALVVGGEPGP